MAHKGKIIFFKIDPFSYWRASKQHKLSGVVSLLENGGKFTKCIQSPNCHIRMRMCTVSIISVLTVRFITKTCLYNLTLLNPTFIQ